MIKVVKQTELFDWIMFKVEQAQKNSTNRVFSNGYIDGLENLKQDIIEGRIPTHLFTGEEEESVIL